MPNPDQLIVDANKHIISSVEEQIGDLRPAFQKQVEIATVEAQLGRFNTSVGAALLDVALRQTLTDAITASSVATSEIRAGTKQLADFGQVLTDLYSFQQSLRDALAKQQITSADETNCESILLSVIGQVRQLLSYRPDVGAVMDDLTAMKNLRGNRPMRPPFTIFTSFN